MATRRRVRSHRALNGLLNDDNDAGTPLDKSLVNNPRPYFHQHATEEHATPSRYEPAERQLGQAVPRPVTEPPQQQQEEIQLDDLTVQTILNPDTSKDVTLHFDMDVTDDVGYLLEEFSRLKRLGNFQAAALYFDEHLRDFDDVLPVVIEYADMLVEQGAYQQLKDFLQPHNQVLQRTTKMIRNITEEERETLLYKANLQLIDAFASMHLTGNMDKPHDMVREVAKTAPAILKNRSPALGSLDSAAVREAPVCAYAIC
jgi:hypothetical protein